MSNALISNKSTTLQLVQRIYCKSTTNRTNGVWLWECSSTQHGVARVQCSIQASYLHISAQCIKYHLSLQLALHYTLNDIMVAHVLFRPI